MLKSSFTRDLADDRQQIEEAFTERNGQPVRLRLQPQVLRAHGKYRAWKDVTWTLDCTTPKEVIGIRNAMQVFFRVLAQVGPEAMIKALTAIPKSGGQVEEVAS